MTNPPVNLEILIRNSGGDEAFVQEIITMCVEQAERQIHQLEDLCVDGVNEDWKHVAHALKGTASTLGAEDMRQMCEVAQKQMLDASAEMRRRQAALIAGKYADAKASLRELGYI